MITSGQTARNTNLDAETKEDRQKEPNTEPGTEAETETERQRQIAKGREGLTESQTHRGRH